MDLVERYLELGLRLGRHVEGLVDAYFGPAEIRTRVDDEELRPPVALAGDADALLADLRADETLDPRRRAWLDDQLVGVATYARVLAGDGVPYADEVERCFGVRPTRVPESSFEAAHARLDGLLVGRGTLAERYDAWRTARIVPSDAMLAAFAGVCVVVRDATRRRFGLPDDEDVEPVLARDEPWLAYNYYLGGRRSRIAVNVDLPIAAVELVDLVAHETYPGHHAEHAWKEARLVTEGVLEESLLLVPTPQCTVSEGIAENALDVVLDHETVRGVEDALAGAGIELDLAAAMRVREARAPLRFVGVNLALMIHEQGASEDEAVAYAERWSAMTTDYARSMVGFVLDPLWRAYASTYSLGGDLVRRHVAGRDDRFRRLLTEQTRVADLAPLSSAA